MKSQFLLSPLCLLFCFTSYKATYSQTYQNLIYATNLGGIAVDVGWHCQAMSDGSFLVVGISESVNMPVTDDAWQVAWGGDFDNHIARFDSEGQFIHGGFLGGVLFDTPYGLAIKNNDGFVIVGSTSSFDFPVTPGAYNEQFIEDMGYVSSFDENHQLIWSTFIGGEGEDIVNDVVTDSNGNVYVTGQTMTPGLATPGVFQESFEGQGGSFVAKFDSEGELIWFSYYSGPNGSSTTSIAISPDGSQLYVGGAGAPDLPMLNSFQPAFGGGTRDAILLCFNAASGMLNWSTYYGGNGVDEILDMKVAEDGRIFLGGETASNNQIASVSAHQPLFGGVTDHFIASFAPEGDRLWSTYFGGEGLEYISFALDLTSNDILITGQTQSQENIISGNPFESENTISQDMFINRGGYIARFSQESGGLIWGTYLLAYCAQGYPADISSVNDSKFVLTGGLGSNCSDITTQDAFQPSSGGMFDIGFFIFEDATITSTKNPEILPLTIYPNPTRDAVRIEIPGQLFAPMALQVYDLTGRIVLEQGAYQSGNMLNVSALSPGMYVVTGRQGDQGFSNKLVLQ